MSVYLATDREILIASIEGVASAAKTILSSHAERLELSEISEIAMVLSECRQRIINLRRLANENP